VRVRVKEGENGHKKRKEENMFCHQKQGGQDQDPER